eukprot:5782824-Amphidinium_carterae.1
MSPFTTSTRPCCMLAVQAMWSELPSLAAVDVTLCANSGLNALFVKRTKALLTAIGSGSA